METHWKAWTDARTEVKARRVADAALERFSDLGSPGRLLRIEPYEKTGGFVLNFAVEFETQPWPEVVMAMIATAQRLGSAWCLTGFIEEEVDATTSRVSLPGITMLQCSLRR